MIFLDTNFLVSFFIEEEDDHDRAVEIAKNIVNEEQIISRLIIAETANLLHNKLKIDNERIKEIYKELNRDYTLIEDHYFYDKALDMMLNLNKRVQFFDCVFITIMKELGIKEIVTFDKHFENIGGITTVN
ncbi:MAG: type II toxin-antitoxin system VapC family toxin [Methanobrevibacter sp.]|jgi:predicted nucleic acid-binding protein|nr:type II toxin-antitoxin system VapC family toxin [Methanobrevibacter sp.]